MAGSRLSRLAPRTTPRRAGVRCLAVAACVVMAAIAGPAARAQVPGLPEVPDPPPVPAPVEDAIEQAKDVLVPIMVDAATAGQPAANAAGFALRPACAATGSVIVVLAIAGGGLPASPAFALLPVLILCSAAFDPGPADPAFETVDGAAGREIESNVDPVLAQVDDALTPVRPELSEVCAVVGLMGSTPRQVPPPLDRLDITGTVC